MTKHTGFTGFTGGAGGKEPTFKAGDKAGTLKKYFQRKALMDPKPWNTD